MTEGTSASPLVVEDSVHPDGRFTKTVLFGDGETVVARLRTGDRANILQWTVEIQRSRIDIDEVLVRADGDGHALLEHMSQLLGAESNRVRFLVTRVDS